MRKLSFILSTAVALTLFSGCDVKKTFQILIIYPNPRKIFKTNQQELRVTDLPNMTSTTFPKTYN